MLGKSADFIKSSPIPIPGSFTNNDDLVSKDSASSDISETQFDLSDTDSVVGIQILANILSNIIFTQFRAKSVLPVLFNYIPNNLTDIYIYYQRIGKVSTILTEVDCYNFELFYQFAILKNDLFEPAGSKIKILIEKLEAQIDCMFNLTEFIRVTGISRDNFPNNKTDIKINDIARYKDFVGWCNYLEKQSQSNIER